MGRSALCRQPSLYHRHDRTADDIEDADGTSVLNFWQAQEKAREIGGKLVYSGPYRVQDALDAYLDHLGPRSEPSSRYRNHILSPLGDVLVEELTADRLRAWLKSMVRGDSEEAHPQKPMLCQ